jgi:3-isopropylmalate dehydrogenase
MDQFTLGAADSVRWTECLYINKASRNANQSVLIGVLQGEGIGPEVICATLEVLTAVTARTNLTIEFCADEQTGEAERIFATSVPEGVICFCENVFARGGAILHGPASGRFVYDLRSRFDLFFKISPLQMHYQLPHPLQQKSDATCILDILVTRENSGGIYQGSWEDAKDTSGGRLARHQFAYSEVQVRRFLHASARLAKQRRRDMTVVWKESGIPSISKLWHDCAMEAAKANSVSLRMIDIDLMAYRLIREPQAFDVIAAPNLFGDILADLGAALLGSRGASFSGNYSETANAVYQTNHGAALDIAGTDRANPAGQIFASAMLLRESFGLGREAKAIEDAMRSVWRDGWRTEDVAVPGTRVIGTREMGCRVAERAAQILGSRKWVVGMSVGNETAAHPS